MRHSFTDRQMEVMDLIAEGKSVREIARLLHLSEDAIKHHRMNIRAEIELRAGQSLKEWLYGNGWEKPETGV